MLRGFQRSYRRRRTCILKQPFFYLFFFYFSKGIHLGAVWKEFLHTFPSFYTILSWYFIFCNGLGNSFHELQFRINTEGKFQFSGVSPLTTPHDRLPLSLLSCCGARHLPCRQAASSSADRCHSLRSLAPPPAALPSLP